MVPYCKVGYVPVRYGTVRYGIVQYERLRYGLVRYITSFTFFYVKIYFSLRYVMVLCVMVKLYCTFSKFMYVYSQVCEWCPSARITTTPHHGHAWTRRHQSQTGTARDLLMWNPVLYGKATLRYCTAFTFPYGVLQYGALHYVKVQHVWYVKRHKISKFRNK
jgi:hypothetical protein